MKELPKDVEAQITFLPTNLGGRKGYCVSGYSPQFHYDGHDWVAIHTYPDVERVNPGDTVKAYLAFLRPDLLAGKLIEGSAFEIHEGNRVVAYGRVTRVLELQSAERIQNAGKTPLLGA
jgi:translation elongation factor EF-Tu-like GTPase